MKKIDVIIIGAGPVGLFAVHQLGIKGLKAVVIDNLDKAGGQCIELYPDKPIYDIPGVPECTGEELTKRLLEQIKPFKTELYLNERVEEVHQEKDNWIVNTNNKKEFMAPNIIIAGGVGSFEPRKISLKKCEKFEGKWAKFKANLSNFGSYLEEKSGCVRRKVGCVCKKTRLPLRKAYRWACRSLAGRGLSRSKLPGKSPRKPPRPIATIIWCRVTALEDVVGCCMCRGW